jgi:hypothetical protein
MLRNLTTATDVTAAFLVLNFDSTTNTLIIEPASGVVLPTGNYRLTLSGAGITDNGGRSLSADVVVIFHVLPGDSNGDRVVNDRDLYLIWQNLLLPPANRDQQFDLNNDGAVTSADLDVVRANYRNSLPEAAPAAGLSTPNENLNAELLAVVASAEPLPAPDSTDYQAANGSPAQTSLATLASPVGFLPGHLFEWRAATEFGMPQGVAAAGLMVFQASSGIRWQTNADNLSAFSSALRTPAVASEMKKSPSPSASRTLEHSSSPRSDMTLPEETRSQKPHRQIART